MQNKDNQDVFFEQGGAGDQEYDQAYDQDQDFPVIRWKAQEYIHHQKTPLWYAITGLVFAVLALALYIILRDRITIVLLAVMGVALFVYANKKPRTLNYIMSNDGISIENNDYTFSQFRSFSIMQDDEHYSVELAPLQRMKPITSIYFDPDNGEEIIEILSNFLPLEQKAPDLIDRLIRLARF